MTQESSPRKLLILYGSQTGTAQDVAEMLAREARRYHFQAQVLAMDEYDKAELVQEKLVVFVCATTGQGEEPDNMKKFWKFLLRKNLPHDVLSNLEYTVFGLGDSSYIKYNFPAKKLYKRLAQLGATSFYPVGYGDDQHYLGYNGGLDPWQDGLWKTLLDKYPLPVGVEIIPADVLPPPSFRVEFLEKLDANGELLHRIENKISYEGFSAKVVKNERITASDHFQDVRHIELALDDKNVSYQPGDVLVIHPQNLPEAVSEFLDYMGWAEIADKPFRLLPNERRLPSHLPAAVTLRTLLLNYLDIFGRPRRTLFEMLAHFTTDELHTEKLREFCTPEGQDELFSYCYRPKRTVFEVLKDFGSATIPLDYIFDVFAEMKPRSFSIASSGAAHPHEIHLCVAIVNYNTKMKTPREGICTKWMATLCPGDRLTGLSISRGTMRLPPELEIPAVFIGPGTGVAPMRSLIEERIQRGARENFLYFGGRKKDKDFYYQDEWNAYLKEGQLFLYSAFSRDQIDKIYVQHRLLENAKEIWRSIGELGGRIYLSGRSDKMPEQVREAIRDIIMKEGNMSPTDAEAYLKRMEQTGRYQQECWS
ncbi:uncharacterized protein VTP21DRAFT_546 [Calcarisporiella thermophila]|uniref:uncharacterized protein n=1 Tax=Calcarisporiella thermophila TaxID=911321 RepID=UPI00374329CD